MVSFVRALIKFDGIYWYKRHCKLMMAMIFASNSSAHSNVVHLNNKLISCLSLCFNRHGQWIQLNLRRYTLKEYVLILWVTFIHQFNWPSKLFQNVICSKDKRRQQKHINDFADTAFVSFVISGLTRIPILKCQLRECVCVSIYVYATAKLHHTSGFYLTRNHVGLDGR